MSLYEKCGLLKKEMARRGGGLVNGHTSPSRTFKLDDIQPVFITVYAIVTTGQYVYNLDDDLPGITINIRYGEAKIPIEENETATSLFQKMIEKYLTSHERPTPHVCVKSYIGVRSFEGRIPEKALSLSINEVYPELHATKLTANLKKVILKARQNFKRRNSIKQRRGVQKIDRMTQALAEKLAEIPIEYQEIVLEMALLPNVRVRVRNFMRSFTRNHSEWTDPDVLKEAAKLALVKGVIND